MLLIILYFLFLFNSNTNASLSSLDNASYIHDKDVNIPVYFPSLVWNKINVAPWLSNNLWNVETSSLLSRSLYKSSTLIIFFGLNQLFIDLTFQFYQ